MNNIENLEKIIEEINKNGGAGATEQQVIYIGAIAQYLAIIADELGTIANAIGGEYTV